MEGTKETFIQCDTGMNLSAGAWYKLVVFSIAVNWPCRTPSRQDKVTTLMVCDTHICIGESAMQNGHIEQTLIVR
jgi:hypothetical protein